jgi:acyl-CoA thioesterase-2
MTPIETLVETLTLEPIEVNLFRGKTLDHEWNRNRIYGGQVIAQALRAAHHTVEGRVCHSLQAYFIRPGDPKVPVLYEVERSRDGKSFTTRRVIAIQHGEQILNLAASFQVEEPGFEHQSTMPDLGGPLATPTDQERMRLAGKDVPDYLRELAEKEQAIEVRRIDPVNPLKPRVASPTQRVWFRAAADVGDDRALNQCVLAYATDMTLLGTCLRPHGESWTTGVQTASLDHVVWFHRPNKAHHWHLYDQDSPSASGARGFNRGTIYDEAGRLVASVCQEGLIRKR